MAITEGESAPTSRDNLNRAELLEVMIEGESLSDTQLLNDNLASTISEAPILVGEILKYFPGQSELRGGDLMDYGEFRPKELCAQQKRPFSLSTRSEQG